MKVTRLLVGAFLAAILAACGDGEEPRPVSRESDEPTLQDSADGAFIIVDFELCASDKRRFDVDFGSTTVEVVGTVDDGDTCVVNLGGEIENPRWDGILDTHCEVPTSLGKIEFEKHIEGADYTEIQDYCTGPWPPYLGPAPDTSY
jgi:hypothetical protein